MTKLVEQAIYTSAETNQASGYQLVARSPGVCEADARELAVWCPTHDSLLEFAAEAESWNFHPLPSGAYCLSRTTATGLDGDGYGKQRAYTQCLILPPEVLARFGNNPFPLAKLAMERGIFQPHSPPWPRLEPVALMGGATAVDAALLRELAADPGPQQMAALVQAARDGVCLAVAGTTPPARWIDGLLNLLPPQCRLEYSFATGLKFSPRRSFRLVGLSNDPAERLWAASHPNVSVLTLGPDALPHPMPLDGWARLVERVLATDRVAFLAAQLSKRRFDLSADDLPALGLQLIEDFEDRESHEEEAWETGGDSPASAPPSRAHAAHRQFAKSLETLTATALRAAAPSARINAGSPEVLAKLEQLDDLVYEAIGGQSAATEQLRTLWPALVEELGEALLADSREQYLRYAISIWESCSEKKGGVRNPARAVEALDVLCLLFGEAG